MKLISKLKYQWNDFLFNLKLFPLPYVLKYYYHSYVINNIYVKVKIKHQKAAGFEFVIRTRNKFDRNGLENVFGKSYHYTSSSFLDKDNPVILDIGSNIGLTIIDYKLTHPSAIIYGYEMNEPNYRTALLNCENFSNVTISNEAVWIEKGFVGYSDNVGSDAFSIDSSKQHHNKVPCLSINDILVRHNLTKVDFLKMDIEGAEIHILNADLSWLQHVFSLNIEFHDITEAKLEEYVQLFETFGFTACKSALHWNAIEAVKLVTEPVRRQSQSE